MDDWPLIIVRLIPLVIWSVVVEIAPRVIRQEESNPELFTRRMLVIWLVEGACIALFAGGLASAGLVTADVARVMYSAFGAIVAISGGVLIHTYWKR